MTEPMADERYAEIKSALDAVPAPPWHWIGDTKHQGPMLATKHSGWIYVMAFRRLGMRGAQPAFPVKGPGGRRVITPAKDMVIPRAPYDPDTVRGIDNPVARWLEHSAEYAKELLAEAERLRKELNDQGVELDQAVDERDEYEKRLDAFAYAVAPVEVIGEHTSGNDPWANALDMVTPATEVERLQRAVQLLGAHLQGGARDFVDALAEIERRLPIEHVERFLKRERDRHEKTDVSWAALDDALDTFRLHMVTGTSLTEPRPAEGPEAYGAGREPLTEAEELRAENERLRAELADLQGQNAMTESNFDNFAEGAIAEQDQLRKRAETAEADAERLERVTRRAFEELESSKPHEAEQTLREALFIPAPADEPTPEAARLRVALREAGEAMYGGCDCCHVPCACAADAVALEAALAEEAGDHHG